MVSSSISMYIYLHSNAYYYYGAFLPYIQIGLVVVQMVHLFRSHSASSKSSPSDPLSCYRSAQLPGSVPVLPEQLILIACCYLSPYNCLP